MIELDQLDPSDSSNATTWITDPNFDFYRNSIISIAILNENEIDLLKMRIENIEKKLSMLIKNIPKKKSKKCKKCKKSKKK